nr:hypothetical protein BaRGS_025809 [Batillaria attramentaria]
MLHKVNTTPFVTVAAVAVPLVVVVTVVLAVLLWWRWRKGQKLAHLIKMEGAEFRSYTYFMPVQGADVGGADSHVVADEWELPHSSLKVGPVLGSGAFGQVLLGRVSRAMLRHRGLPSHYSDPETCGKEGDDVDNLMAPVAIKMLKEGCDDAGKAEFLREIRLMKDLGHHSHVVSMLGCCTLREPYCLLAVEENGPYENQEVQFISPMDLLSFARQIALGMEFLSDKGYVHRDLAARNVLVGDRNEVKVGDFGLARYVYTDRVYVNRKGGKLPLKWMSVESIFDLTFSTASDVWSFGVVLFEIVTLGGTPYPTLAVRDLLTALKTGYRMERPDNCSDEM